MVSDNGGYYPVFSFSDVRCSSANGNIAGLVCDENVGVVTSRVAPSKVKDTL